MRMKRRSQDHRILFWGVGSGDKRHSVRSVVWPKGAPPRSEVPHGGDEVVVNGGTIKYTVVHGIPIQIHNNSGNWSLQTRNNETGVMTHYRLSRITPWVEPKPKCDKCGPCGCDTRCECVCVCSCGCGHHIHRPTHTSEAVASVMRKYGYGEAWISKTIAELEKDSC